jgi:sulfite oxidase
MKLSRRTLIRMAAGAVALPALSFDDSPPIAKKAGMLVRSARPEDLEMPLAFFSDYITPVEHFFVRTHTYAPQVQLADWRVKVDGEVQNPLTLTMADLKQLPRVELVAVTECAGNSRGFYEPPVPGLQWTNGSVGNGRWAGVRLADVLKKAGLKNSAREILFDGADVPPGTMPDFQRTITLKKALDPNTLLAFEMNGQTLPVQHGFPLRVVAPGWASDSWTKWVTRITVLDREFDGFFMKTAYRHPGKPVRPGEAVPPEKMQPVTSLRVKSVIGSPADGSSIAPSQPVHIAGAAWAGDAGPVAGVDVSTDGGRTWRPSQLSGERSQFGWRLWSLDWTPKSEQYFTIMARARTAAGDMQPFRQEWNPSGYQWNVVPSVGVNVTSQAAGPSSAHPDQASPDYPAGYQQACLPCHGNDVVTQQRLTRAQWDREVNKMVNWGAKVKPEDREGILAYLAKYFGPRTL